MAWFGASRRPDRVTAPRFAVSGRAGFAHNRNRAGYPQRKGDLTYSFPIARLGLVGF
jgi:hypothetical protein